MQRTAARHTTTDLLGLPCNLSALDRVQHRLSWLEHVRHLVRFGEDRVGEVRVGFEVEFDLEASVVFVVRHAHVGAERESLQVVLLDELGQRFTACDGLRWRRRVLGVGCWVLDV